MRRLYSCCAAVLLLLAAATTHAATIDVLWYSYSGPASSYEDSITTLATTADTYGPGSGLSWNLTFFNPADTPDFGDYDVLVTQSFDFSGLDYSGLLNNKAAIEAARGNRTFVTGQDADYHYINGPGTIDDGPFGFLVNAVNWAASGTGLGIVALIDGWEGSGSQWILDPDSFLHDELDGFVTYQQDESVVIPPATAGFPVNAGLTTGGLSGWGTSAHGSFDKNIPDYLSINDNGSFPDYAVTIVTESEAGGDTTPPNGPVVPEPSTFALLGLGALGLLAKRRRK